MPRSVPRARHATRSGTTTAAQDGKWLALAMLQTDRYWPDFARAIGRPELATDARFKDLNARAGNAAECVAILDAAFASKPRAEWMRILNEDPRRLHLHAS